MQNFFHLHSVNYKWNFNPKKTFAVFNLYSYPAINIVLVYTTLHTIATYNEKINGS